RNTQSTSVTTNARNHAARNVSRLVNPRRQVPTVQGLRFSTNRQSRRTHVRTVSPGAADTSAATIVADAAERARAEGPSGTLGLLTMSLSGERWPSGARK